MHIIISDANNRLFLLGHLCGYAEGIDVGTIVTQKTIVGYVGNTGNCKSDVPKKEGGGTHLHLTVYITDAAKKIANKKTKKQMEEAVNLLLEIKCNDGSFSYKSYSDSTISVVNPFDYSEKRIR